jgi:protein-disulfide isomerase
MGTHLAGLVAACGILSVSPLRQPKKAGKESLSFPNPGAKTIVRSALVGLTVLVVGQIAYQPTGSIVKVKSPGTSVDPANTQGRSVSLLNGQFRLSLQDEPLLGDPNAPHVLVNIFDYTCYACRVLHEQLAEAQKALSNQFVVVSLPAPLNRTCNPAVTEAYPGHEEGCEYARVGLAVWRAKPSAFGPFTDWVFSSEYPPPVAQAQLRAEELVGKQALASALQDSRIEEEIRRNVAIYATNYLAIGQHSLPQLFVGTNLTVGAFRKKEGLLKLLQDELHLKVD